MAGAAMAGGGGRAARPAAPRRSRWIAVLACLALGAPCREALRAAPAPPPTVAHLYQLADFSGTVPYSDVTLHADRRADEVYAALGNAVRVFNAAGMEIHRFDLDPGHGFLAGIATEASGDLLLLTAEREAPAGRPAWSILRADFRGEPTGRIAPTGLPPGLADFRPNAMVVRNDQLLIASLGQMRAALFDRGGAFRKGYDLAALIGVKDGERGNHEMGGFDVDRHGNLLFTVPTLFQAFVVSPDGRVQGFGKVGSTAGGFSVTGGIVTDDRGHLFVADKGRDRVLIFDDRGEFLTEFGADDPRSPGSLIRPTALALGRGGKLYVTQARDRGVAVFRIGDGRPAE